MKPRKQKASREYWTSKENHRSYIYAYICLSAGKHKGLNFYPGIGHAIIFNRINEAAVRKDEIRGGVDIHLLKEQKIWDKQRLDCFPPIFVGTFNRLFTTKNGRHWLLLLLLLLFCKPIPNKEPDIAYAEDYYNYEYHNCDKYPHELTVPPLIYLITSPLLEV